MIFPSPRTCAFFARVADRDLLDLIEFYREDIKTIESLGFRVETSTRNRQLLRRERPTIAYCWWHHSAILAIVYFRLRRVPVVVTGALHLSDPGAQTPRDRARHWLTRLGGRLATLTLAISDVERHDFDYLPDDRCFKIPLGVETDFFVPGPSRHGNAGITIGQLNPVSISRKGIDIAIACVPQVARVVPDFHLHVVGPATPEGTAMINGLVATSDPTRITVHGEVTRERKLQLLQSCRVYLQPSQFEGFGLAALEALSCGVPVVHSGRGSLPEVVGPAGLEASERTPDAFAAATIQCLTSAAADPPMEAVARAQALSLSRSARRVRLGETLDGVLARRARGGRRWRRH